VWDRHGDSKKKNPGVLILHPKFQPLAFRPLVSDPRGWKGWGSGGEVVENPKKTPQKNLLLFPCC